MCLNGQVSKHYASKFHCAMGDDKEQIEKRNQEILAKNGASLRRRSSKQTRMTLECGPVYPHGRRENQNQRYLAGTLLHSKCGIMRFSS